LIFDVSAKYNIIPIVLHINIITIFIVEILFLFIPNTNKYKFYILFINIFKIKKSRHTRQASEATDTETF